MKRLYVCFVLVFFVLTLIGCSTSKTEIKETFEPVTEAETRYEVKASEDQMTLAKRKVEEEMRIFDVEAHHDALYAEISSIDKGLTEAEIKVAISEIVKVYMDAYFLEKTRDILSEYNENYAESDVETLFESTSRTPLYALITLYELSFYNNNR